MNVEHEQVGSDMSGPHFCVNIALASDDFKHSNCAAVFYSVILHLVLIAQMTPSGSGTALSCLALRCCSTMQYHFADSITCSNMIALANQVLFLVFCNGVWVCVDIHNTVHPTHLHYQP